MRIPSIQLKAAALVPMPSVRQRIARIENPGVRRKHSHAEANILNKFVGPSPDPLFARDFFGLLDSAELSQRRVARLIRRHSRGDVSLGQKIEMRLHFLRHLGVTAIFAKTIRAVEKTRRERRGIIFSAPTRTRSIPLVIRNQCLFLAASCLRPAEVSL